MTEGRNKKDLSAGLFYFPVMGHTGSPDQYRGKHAAQMKYKDEKQGKGSTGRRMESTRGDWSVRQESYRLPVPVLVGLPVTGPPYLHLSG